MALEEMLVCDIPAGALYYIETRRREVVPVHGRTPQNGRHRCRNEPLFRPRLHAKKSNPAALQRLLVKIDLSAGAVQPCRPLSHTWRAHIFESEEDTRETTAQHPVRAQRRRVSLRKRRKMSSLVASKGKSRASRCTRSRAFSVFSPAGASPALMGACVQRGGHRVFLPARAVLARTVGEERGNVLLRQTQNRVSDDPYQSCRYARGFIPRQGL